jgi:hypothetical protein
MNSTHWKVAGLLAILLVVPASLQSADAEKERQPNTLSEREQKEGWKLLFDGKTTNGWHAYRGKDVPGVWKVADGTLFCSRKNGDHAGDIVTDDEYGSFELAFEWQVTPGANSGVMYRVTEGAGEPWFTGPEYQILDNTKHPDGRKPKTCAASCYALYAPSEDKTKPVGEWNQSRIVINGPHVEHWLNGTKVVEYDFGSEDWKSRVGSSKFRKLEKFGKEPKGHIDLQFHGDEVHYRSIRIRPIEEKK